MVGVVVGDVVVGATVVEVVVDLEGGTDVVDFACVWSANAMAASGFGVPPEVKSAASVRTTMTAEATMQKGPNRALATPAKAPCRSSPLPGSSAPGPESPMEALLGPCGDTIG